MNKKIFMLQIESHGLSDFIVFYLITNLKEEDTNL